MGTPPPPPAAAPAFAALISATRAAATDWGSAAAAALAPAAAAALAEAAPGPLWDALRDTLAGAGWDGAAFAGGAPRDARALLSRLKALHFSDLVEVGKGSYAVVYKVRERAGSGWRGGMPPRTARVRAVPPGALARGDRPADPPPTTLTPTIGPGPADGGRHHLETLAGRRRRRRRAARRAAGSVPALHAAPPQHRAVRVERCRLGGREGESGGRGAIFGRAGRGSGFLIPPRHPCPPPLVSLRDVLWDRRRLYLILEYADLDLRALLDSEPTPLAPTRVASYTHQILSALAHAHAHRVLHRDLKPQNVLVCGGGRETVKVADFGLARTFTLPVRPYTHDVVTLWYRAPEILLGSPCYSTPVDVWAAGCVLAELASGLPLFPGDSEVGQLMAIFQTLGTPTEGVWPGVTALPDWCAAFPSFAGAGVAAAAPRLGPAGADLLSRMLTFNPAARISARDALAHPFFDGVRGGGGVAAAATATTTTSALAAAVDAAAGLALASPPAIVGLKAGAVPRRPLAPLAPPPAQVAWRA